MIKRASAEIVTFTGAILIASLCSGCRGSYRHWCSCTNKMNCSRALSLTFGSLCSHHEPRGNGGKDAMHAHKWGFARTYSLCTAYVSVSFIDDAQNGYMERFDSRRRRRTRRRAHGDTPWQLPRSHSFSRRRRRTHGDTPLVVDQQCKDRAWCKPCLHFPWVPHGVGSQSLPEQVNSRT